MRLMHREDQRESSSVFDYSSVNIRDVDMAGYLIDSINYNVRRTIQHTTEI